MKFSYHKNKSGTIDILIKNGDKSVVNLHGDKDDVFKIYSLMLSQNETLPSVEDLKVYDNISFEIKN